MAFILGGERWAVKVAVGVKGSLAAAEPAQGSSVGAEAAEAAAETPDPFFLAGFR